MCNIDELYPYFKNEYPNMKVSLKTFSNNVKSLNTGTHFVCVFTNQGFLILNYTHTL